MGSMSRTLNSLFFLRTAYTIAAEKVKVAPTAPIIREVKEAKEKEREVFWMRDPKTGYWKPENKFDEVDVAELREKFLSKKSHS